MPRKILLALLFCTALVSQAIAQSPFNFFEPVNPPRQVQVMVHRGMSQAAPENSTAAIQMCADDFCEWAEIDVRLTKDGQHVIIHDDTVDSTTDGTGRVSDFTLEELRKLDAGSWFAKRFAGNRLLTLKEALAVAKGKINLYLDCKKIDPKLLAGEVITAGMERQVIVYDSPTVLALVKTASNGTVAGMTKYRPSMDFRAFVKDVAPAAVEIDADQVTADLCQRFHAAGIKVQAKVLGEKWDNPEVWGKVIDAGVDWLQTDRPAGILFFNARKRIGNFPVMIACHRGASRYAPENTIPAIRDAAAMDVDFAEIDIRTTSDGKTVLMHDNSVNRTTQSKGPVREHTFEQLTGLSAGEWFGTPFRDTKVPSFDEGLAAYGPKMGVYLDCKDISPETLISAIKKYGFLNRHVVYQSVEYCDRLRKLDPTVRAMPPLRRVEDIKVVAAISAYAVDANWAVLSKDVIDECHRNGIKVFSDALGKNESIEQYTNAINWGIDCIQTDHPLKVLRAIELVSKASDRR
jgi:glycerophosphoryl diester phosphodiesterase